MEIIERYEHKFLIPERIIPEIRSFALTTSRVDTNARQDGTYTIRSLYFDTPTLDLYTANDREQGRRFKARVRMYPGATSPCFLEVKQRSLDVIVKSRAAVSRDRWRQAIACDSATVDALPARSRSGVLAFASKVHTHHLAPVLLVEYEREAYVSEVDSYARLTFDRRIRVQPRTELELDADEGRWRSIDHVVQTRTAEPATVLELKFERRPPAWMHAMVRRLELVRYGFSKYCYGLRDELTLPSADRIACAPGAA
ncbi:MAG: polyphosphate polymerase domain-containing protein [Labilithrix sp.]|nr:polyphosphate polymerase domain-containing protein [Labilithrix sp.]MBX3220565.1 polyphosphate polymerase domain-containing protein [Labilithrix sp.]